MRIPVLPVLAALALLGCSDRHQGDAVEGKRVPGSDLTLEIHGEVSREVATRRLPKVILLRGAMGLSCEVSWDPTDRPAWVEVSRDGDHAERRAPGSGQELARASFVIEPPLPLVVTVRSGFPNGQVWRRRVRL